MVWRLKRRRFLVGTGVFAAGGLVNTRFELTNVESDSNGHNEFRNRTGFVQQNVPSEFELPLPLTDLNDATILSGTGDIIINWDGGGWEEPRTERLAELIHMLHIDGHTSGPG